MSFDQLQRAQETNWKCTQCGYHLGKTFHNFDETSQLDRLRANLNGHCPRCNKELSKAPIPVAFPQVYFLLKSFIWRIKKLIVQLIYGRTWKNDAAGGG